MPVNKSNPLISIVHITLHVIDISTISLQWFLYGRNSWYAAGESVRVDWQWLWWLLLG